MDINFKIQAFLGLFFFVFVAVLLSHNRKKISWSYVGKGILLQIVLAFLFLKIPFVKAPIVWMNQVIVILNEVTLEATQFMFGYLAGGNAPFKIEAPPNNFIIAFQVLPLILVVSTISSILFHIGVLPWLIKIFSKLLTKTFQISGPLSFGASSTVFLGTIEAPLVIKPYLEKMSKSDLLALLCCSMATIAGTVMVLYASVLEKVVASPLSHLLTASIISVPAALILAHIVLPDSQSKGKEQSDQSHTYKSPYTSTVEAAVDGIGVGLQMVLQIIATIIVLFAFVYLINRVLGFVGTEIGYEISLESMLGVLISPFLFFTGIPFEECLVAGKLMASKIVLNEFVAFLQLGQLKHTLQDQSLQTLIYCLCGFANIASLGIIVGGLGSLIPERRMELIALGGRSLIIGNLATLMTGSIVTLLS